MASAIFGIGGGSLTVPYLNKNGVVMQQAVATSAACGLPLRGHLALCGLVINSTFLFRMQLAIFISMRLRASVS